ncbi:MAG: hypothetical protein ACFCD0_24725 [Gemmataceae bacterium]
MSEEREHLQAIYDDPDDGRPRYQSLWLVLVLSSEGLGLQPRGACRRSYNLSRLGVGWIGLAFWIFSTEGDTDPRAWNEFYTAKVVLNTKLTQRVCRGVGNFF